MISEYVPTNSEVLVIIGAGATAALKMPSTDEQTKILRALSGEKESSEKILADNFSEPDLSKIVKFLNLLDAPESNQFEISEIALENARFIYKHKDDKILSNRILELRQKYDWNALKKIIKLCPNTCDLEKCSYDDNLIRDVYSIIDKKLMSKQSIKVSLSEDKEEILPVSRIQGARNFLTLFINMMFASKWYNITKDSDSELALQFEKYKQFINSFDRLMREEGHRFFRLYNPEERDFYLFTTSFVSFNFEMVFPWIFMNSHRNLNKYDRTYIQDRPLKLWLDYGVEHRGRKTDENQKVLSTLEFTEAVASRENEADHIGTPLNRCGKFYFAHGSSNWRECPVCGRMTFYFGYSENKWDYKSKELISPFPIPLFENDEMEVLTAKEQEWRKENLQYDALQCMHCGSKTEAYDAPMIMQTMHKSIPTSFLEEIQRNVKVSMEKARHIVLLGYSLPKDDIVWQQALSEAVRSRNDSQKAFCSVVIGLYGKHEWLYEEELLKFIKDNKYGSQLKGAASAIENAISIFGLNYVRAWTGGIPQVFGNCTEKDVKNLLYPDFITWNKTRLEK